jgi:hypothetical protein
MLSGIKTHAKFEFHIKSLQYARKMVSTAGLSSKKNEKISKILSHHHVTTTSPPLSPTKVKK